MLDFILYIAVIAGIVFIIWKALGKLLNASKPVIEQYDRHKANQWKKKKRKMIDQTEVGQNRE